MSTGKHLKTERTINIYRKSKSKYLGTAMQEINIDSIPLDTLREIVSANHDDPFLYDGYELYKEQLDKLNTHIENRIIPDFNKYGYFLECYGIHDLDKK